MDAASARRFALGAIAFLTIVACDAAPSPPRGGVARPASPTPTPVPTPTPIPTPEPSPTPIPVWDDVAFQERSRALCVGARPKGLYDISGPYRPPKKAPGYQGVHIVVLEVRDPDGTIGPPPALPVGAVYYYDWALKELRELGIHAIFPEQVDLLACLALRAGEPKVYSGVGPGGGGAVAVAPAAAIVWMVDAGRGSRLGAPWVESPYLGSYLGYSDIVSLGRDWSSPSGKTYGLSMVAPTDFGIVQFLGLVRPAGGGFQTGFGFSGDKSNRTLPEGTSISDATFVLRLVVLEEESAVIDFVEVFCAPDGTVAPPRRVATSVALSLGEFEAASADVAVVGEFVGAGAAAGTIRALSASATACGIPDRDEWSAFLDLDVVPAGGGYVASVRPDL